METGKDNVEREDVILIENKGRHSHKEQRGPGVRCDIGIDSKQDVKREGAQEARCKI